ncbi:MAG: POTRA domain-containing protein [Candidatus Symbiobacter sp.]|nr:POTRA domain-containing protein [Candidatus Symbiobacter sp.]
MNEDKLRILLLAAWIMLVSSGMARPGLAWAGGAAGYNGFNFPSPVTNVALPVPSFTIEPNDEDDVPISPSTETGQTEQTEPSGQASQPGLYAIKKITVSGSTIYSQAELDEMMQPFIGKEVTKIKILQEAAQVITDRYRKDGYFLSHAYAPEQTVRDGDYKLAVTEGYVSEVVLEGDVGPVESLLRSFLAHIPEKRPLNLSDAERYLQLARDVPGISLSSIFRRATNATGGRELHVKVERRLYGGSLNIDNRGSIFIGPGQSLARIYTDSNSILGEHVEFLYSNSWDAQKFQFTGAKNALNQQRYFGLSTTALVGNDGVQLQLSGAYARANPGGPLNPDGTPNLDYLTTIGYKIMNQSLTTGVSYPIIRSSSFNLATSAQFSLNNSVSTLTAIDTGETSVVAKSRNRSIRATLQTDFPDGFSGNQNIALSVYQGLLVFGSSPATGDSRRRTGERNGAKANFTKLTLDVTSNRKIWVYDSGLINSYLYLGGQYAFVPLPSLEQFSAGGQRCGRGYPTGRLSEIIPTDHGLCISTELQWSQNVDLDLPEGPIRPMFFTFFDFARGFARASIDPATGAPIPAAGPRNLSSTGFGIRTVFPNRIQFDIEADLPLANARTYGLDPLPATNNAIPRRWGAFFRLAWNF